MTLLLVLVLFLLFGLAASRFGSDTRVGREWTRIDRDDMHVPPPTPSLR